DVGEVRVERPREGEVLVVEPPALDPRLGNLDEERPSCGLGTGRGERARLPSALLPGPPEGRDDRLFAALLASRPDLEPDCFQAPELGSPPEHVDRVGRGFEPLAL